MPMLGWGGDRRVKVVNPTLTSDLKYRASRASVNRKLRVSRAADDGSTTLENQRRQLAAADVGQVFENVVSGLAASRLCDGPEPT